MTLTAPQKVNRPSPAVLAPVPARAQGARPKSGLPDGFHPFNYRSDCEGCTADLSSPLGAAFFCSSLATGAAFPAARCRFVSGSGRAFGAVSLCFPNIWRRCSLSFWRSSSSNTTATFSPCTLTEGVWLHGYIFFPHSESASASSTARTSLD
jgi:hypothetical protein